MPKFDLYAGVWHPEYQGCYSFTNLEEATDHARQLAIDEYQSYGVLSFDECREDAIESWGCEDWTDSDFEDFYNETIESTVSYYAKAVV